MRYIKHLFVRSFYQCAAPARLALLCAGFAALGGCTNETDSAGGSSTADSHIPLALEITAKRLHRTAGRLARHPRFGTG